MKKAVKAIKTSKTVKAPKVVVIQAPPVQKPMINPAAARQRGAVPLAAPMPRRTAPVPMAVPPSFKKGGKVKKTGMALVHKGETVKTEKMEMKGMKKGGKC